uniref:Uncharacterized protein n=1 Tax=Rhizophora mucronata TaxID=61149 RepID=A0A2P2PX58_RHIMU
MCPTNCLSMALKRRFRCTRLPHCRSEKRSHKVRVHEG